jgi:fructose-bisphosphate aldolase class II
MTSVRSLKEYIADARARGVAIAHFNVAELTTLNAIVNVARELQQPVIIGTSEGEREWIGPHEAVALVKSYRAEGLPIFLNADHTHSLDKVREAAEAGYDAVLFDGGKLPWEENIQMTQEAVRIVRGVNPDILVEGEVGYIGSGSEVLGELPSDVQFDPASLTSPEQAQEFVQKTGVDLFAPAVGNLHGMLASGHDPRLDIPRIKEIAQTAGVPLVLHGGSGTADEDLKAAVQAGVTIVHISTELRAAWRKGLEAGLTEHPHEVAPYKVMQEAETGIEAVVRQRMLLFANPQ